MGFLGISSRSTGRPVVENPRGTASIRTCSISPDNLLVFVGNLARFHRIACSFSPDNLLVFTGYSARFRPEYALPFTLSESDVDDLGRNGGFTPLVHSSNLLWRRCKLVSPSVPKPVGFALGGMDSRLGR
jgi:hypothetical protein